MWIVNQQKNRIFNLNQSSKQNMNDTVKACFRTKNIPLSNIRKNTKNFYRINEVEKLAEEIKMVGLLENLTVVYSPDEVTNTEYKLIGGERRFKALQLLVEKGFEEFKIVTCNIRSASTEDEEMIDLIICNSQRKKTSYELIKEEENLKAALTNLKATGGTIRGIDINKGRLRDTISKILNLSNTKVAQIENINNNLYYDFLCELKDENITFTTANELAGLSEDEQKELYENYKINGEITLKEIKEIKNKVFEETNQKDEIISEELEGQISTEDILGTTSYYDRQNNYLNLGMSFFDYRAITILIEMAEENTILYLTDTFEIDININKLENEDTKNKETKRILDDLYMILKNQDEYIRKYIIETLLGFYEAEKRDRRTEKKENINTSNKELQEEKVIEVEEKEELEIISEDEKNKMINSFIEAFNLKDDFLIQRHNIEWLIEDLRNIEKMDVLKKDVFNKLAISLYTPKNGKKVARQVQPILNSFIEKLRFKSERIKWEYICDLLGLAKDVNYEKIPFPKTPKDHLINKLFLAKINHYNYIGVAIGRKEEKEFHINTYENIEKKIKYYIDNYTDNLTLKNNSEINILKVEYGKTAGALIEFLEGNKYL